MALEPTTSVSAEPPDPPFHHWPQLEAQRAFSTLLKSHLPEGAMLYNRMLVPHNTLDRHCLYGGTITPLSLPCSNTSSSTNPFTPTPESPPFALLFADRSRHFESQIWLFASLSSHSTLTVSQISVLKSQLRSALRFLKKTEVPEAPGHPFSSTLTFACVNARTSEALVEVAEEFGGDVLGVEGQRKRADMGGRGGGLEKGKGAFLWATIWNQWFVPLGTPTLSFDNGEGKKDERELEVPAGLHLGIVPEDQLQTVLATSKLPRQRATLLQIPNVALLEDGSEKLVSWVYIGIDGALATLYTVEGWRERGLGLLVARECLRRYRKGMFRVPAGGWEDVEGEEGRLWAFDGTCGWTYSDVERGNKGSESVMRRLGGQIKWQSRYVRIDADLVY